VNVTVEHWGNVGVELWWNVSAEHWWNVSVEHWLNVMVEPGWNVSVDHWWNVTDLEIESTLTNILYSLYVHIFSTTQFSFQITLVTILLYTSNLFPKIPIEMTPRH
jgi:hypothetical protein